MSHQDEELPQQSCRSAELIPSPLLYLKYPEPHASKPYLTSPQFSPPLPFRTFLSFPTFNHSELLAILQTHLHTLFLGKPSFFALLGLLPTRFFRNDFSWAVVSSKMPSLEEAACTAAALPRAGVRGLLLALPRPVVWPRVHAFTWVSFLVLPSLPSIDADLNEHPSS